MNRSAIPSIDTGLRGGAQNNAIDRGWLRLASLGERGSLLRFHRSRPTASVGRHQVLDRELRLEYCARQGLDVVRRPSGGGALYLDPGTLCFSLVLAPAWGPGRDLATLLGLAGRAMGDALHRLGAPCLFKAPNDLEVAGRKIASVFAVAEAEALLLQGTVLLDFDVRVMLEALKVPTEKLSPDGLAAARDRLATLGACMGRELGVDELRGALERGLASALDLRLKRMDGAMDFELPADAGAEEQVFARRVDWSARQEGVVEAVWKGGGATLRARAGLAEDGRRFRAVQLAGDLHLAAPEWLGRLEAALEGLPTGLARRRVEEFCREQPPDAVGAGAEDFAGVLEMLAQKQAATATLGLGAAEASALMLHGAQGGGVQEVLERATVMLVPYCAKPYWCKWRHLDGCSECGLCEVGEAYRLARERGMEVATVTRYEHLVSTLGEMRRRRIPAYVGMCCSNFFIKRHRAFQEAGMPALLMDISGANCYELRQEDQAYAGKFTAEANLDLELLRKVMRYVPASGAGGEPEADSLEGRLPGA